MRDAKTKVYMEFLNYKGDVTDRTLIAEFRSEGWADAFIEGELKRNPIYLGVSDTRLVKEVANA